LAAHQSRAAEFFFSQKFHQTPLHQRILALSSRHRSRHGIRPLTLQKPGILMPISKLTFVRATVAAILVGMAALIAIVAVNYWLVERTRTNSETLTRSRAIRSAITNLRNLVIDAETGQRGFLLTDDGDYLAPYRDAQRRIPETISNLKAALRDDPQGVQELDRLTVLLTAKLAELKLTIEEFRAGNRSPAGSAARSTTRPARAAA